jgi:hypothetical protein
MQYKHLIATKPTYDEKFGYTTAMFREGWLEWEHQYYGAYTERSDVWLSFRVPNDREEVGNTFPFLILSVDDSTVALDVSRSSGYSIYI